jgi:hypothetical protein
MKDDPGGHRMPGLLEIKKGGNSPMFPPLSLPFLKWIQPVMEGPPRAGMIIGFRSAAVGHAATGLVSNPRWVFP